MQVKFKKVHPNAVIPSYAHPGEDAGLDLTCTEIEQTDDYISYKTGLAVEIPKGFYGCLRPRSSNCKFDLLMANGPGTIDSGYRGEIEFRCKRILNPRQLGKEIQGKTYKVGDRVCQLLILPYPMIEPVEVTELEDSHRGEGGYGSTGK